MLRISIVQTTERSATLHLEGHLAGEWVEELRAACEQILSGGEALALDLAEVSLIDRRGIALLVSLSLRAVTLRHCSPFQAEQLRQAAAQPGQSSK